MAKLLELKTSVAIWGRNGGGGGGASAGLAAGSGGSGAAEAVRAWLRRPRLPAAWGAAGRGAALPPPRPARLGTARPGTAADPCGQPGRDGRVSHHKLIKEVTAYGGWWAAGTAPPG